MGLIPKFVCFRFRCSSSCCFHFLLCIHFLPPLFVASLFSCRRCKAWCCWKAEKSLRSRTVRRAVRTSNTGFASTFDFGTTDGESEECCCKGAAVSTLCDELQVKATFNQLSGHRKSWLTPQCVT